MFEIILLIAATGGIASFARGRGGNPWLWGAATVAGYIFVPFLVRIFVPPQGPDLQSARENVQFLAFLAEISWIAVVAFCARFLLGRKYAKPGGMWSCPNCRYLNQPYAVICEACQQPYQGAR